MSAGWLIAAVVLELASCASFVVVFRLFFASIPTRRARRLAWTEMGSGAFLPGGGIGGLAVGGWLMRLSGMPRRAIVRRSSGLFFLTSAPNAAAIVIGGLLLGIGLSVGPRDLPHTWLPALAASLVVGLVLALPRYARGHLRQASSHPWLTDLIDGISDATHALRRPGPRVLGALGYLAFDIAALWCTLKAVGISAPLVPLLLAYDIGYLANLVPIPGGVGVLDVGLAGTLVLYGFHATDATAAVLVYHAIAFWVPGLGGLIALTLLHDQLPGPTASETPPRVEPPSCAVVERPPCAVVEPSLVAVGQDPAPSTHRIGRLVDKSRGLT